MGYDVHITRAESWLDASTRPILLVEWVAYVRSDPEMRLDGQAEAQASQGTLTYENPGIAVWTAYSQDGVDDNHAWFDLRNGCVTVKNPDAEILGKMSRIAVQLGARVQGDEGEDYGLEGLPIEGEAKGPWWKWPFKR
jgi:hypothetical protein